MKVAQFRPCIDLHEGKVKQIVGSTLTSAETPETNFVAEQAPSYFADLYRQDELSGGHVIMLGGGNEDAAREALGAYPGGLQVGGGITPRNAASFLDAGAAKVIVTSFVFCDGKLQQERLSEIVSAVGKEHLVLDLSCRKRGNDYFIVTDRWQKFTELKISPEVLENLSASCSEFLIHAVDVEGKRAGVDAELIDILAKGTPIDCVYAGGICSLSDVELIESAGQGKIHYSVGSALDIFGGTLSYRLLASRNRH